MKGLGFIRPGWLLRATRAAMLVFVAALAVSLEPGGAAARAKPRAEPPSKPRAGTHQTPSSPCPWVGSHQPIAERVATLLGQMTLADKITLVEGGGTANHYLFYMPGIPQLCIPPLREEDGPNGVSDGMKGATELPAGVALAATWDPSLASRYGAVIGAEEVGKGANVNLGPTVNIDRDPRWGRSFEAYSEDPYLNASLATRTIAGVQGQGVMSQVKHFAAYNQETNRNTPEDDVLISDRALHEIYLPAFEAAVQQAQVASVMCAYSMVNNHFSCQNRYLLTRVLDQEWGFPGFVTSDYGAIHNTSAALRGTDEEQPFNTYFGAPLAADVQSGVVPLTVLNTMVERILGQMFRFGLIGRTPGGSPSATVTTPAHVALSTRVAEDGTVLLKNSGSVLPLSPDHGGKIAVIGPAASVSPAYSGGGSARVIPTSTVTPLEGIQAESGGRRRIVYQQGLPADTSLPPIPSSALTPAYAPTSRRGSYSGTLTAPETGTYVLAFTNPCGCYTPSFLFLDGQELLDNPSTAPSHFYSVAVKLRAGQRYSLQISGASRELLWATPSALAPGILQAVAAARSAAAAVVVVSDDTESEAADRPSLDLPSAQNELVSAVAASNPHTVVVINAGAPVLMPWLREVASVLDAWYPGQTSGTALARVLFGDVDPSGHLPVTFPTSLSQVPAATPAQFPGVNGLVHYSEGIDVGYRWYDAQHLRPLFPFGYGLSYTRFAFSKLDVSPLRVNGVHDVNVSATITNTGHRAGADVAQLYLGDPATSGEPPRQLVGFDRVMLAPGQARQVHFTITPRDTWWWNDSTGGWDQTAGRYHLYVGDSSALTELPLRGKFTMTSSPGARRVLLSAPTRMRPGQAAKIRETLTASGDETLHRVRLSLQLPSGWRALPIGPRTFSNVAPSVALTATFLVVTPLWAPATNEVVHATASLGLDALREAGTTISVGSG